jgi:metallo-beta-lactamase family protein
LLTHAHIDHSGLLPKRVKAGFSGPIYATRPTADLLEFMLPDSAKIQRMSAARANRGRQRRGKPEIEPLYTEEDVDKTLALLKPVEYETWFKPHDSIQVRYWNAGHILGSASAEVKYHDNAAGHTMRLLFSGDIGPDEKVFHPEPGGEQGFDYIICESTYGDRNRDDYTLKVRRDMLEEELSRALERGGNIIIPSFAVERSQELLHDIGALMAQGKLKNSRVFLDSPLARKVTEVFIKYAHTLDDIEVDEATLFQDPNFTLVQSVDESKSINRIKSGAIVISASGMADAGRIQHHLKNNIWDRKSTILFVGYQAPGTLGHVITSGKKDVRIHGQQFKVRAAIRRLGNYSAHADQTELLDWIDERGPVVGGVFLNHGDDEARQEMRKQLVQRGFKANHVYTPDFDESFELSAKSAESKGRGKPRLGKDVLMSDWQNDYSAFIADLSTQLEEAEDGAERRKIIAQLKNSLPVS